MSAQSIEPHYSTPLLALVSAIMDFPAPQTATSDDYDALIQQIDQLCPLQHFGMLGLSDTGLNWLYAYKVSDIFKQQLGREQSRITDQLTQLDEAEGWCVFPIEHGQIQWLLARGTPADLPTLRLLLECLAKRLTETQAGSHLTELPSPLIRKDPNWKKKIESISRIMRLANTLPAQALFSQLEAVLRQMLTIEDMLLVRLTSQKLEKIYPAHPHQGDEFISGLCHSTSNIEVSRESRYWHSMPLRLQQQYFAHFIISTAQPLETDDKLFLDFLRGQLTLLLELRRIRQQLNDINTEDSINQRLQQLRQTNLRLQKQLKQHQELERRLQFDALHDPLTQLPNRALLMNHLNHAMTHYNRYKSPGFAVIFIDVDHFKQINDTLGHSAGDQLLKEVSRRLQTCIRQNDLVARLGGDEFVIYLDSSKSDDDISPVLNRIISRLSYPFRLLGNELSITVSLGVSSVSEQTSDISQLLHQADLAMYQAKRNGRSRIVSYSDDCINQNWNSPEEMLARALREGRIVPYFQPVIRLQDSRLTGLEVMARWLTEEGILKDAFDFIPLAEQCGLILELDYQILRHTCQQLKNWLPISGQGKFKVAINLSGKHLVNHDHIMRLMGIIEEEGVAPGYLIFEFNERELSRQDSDALASLHDLRAKGIQISLDDFGTGFSSLNALFHFPVDYIKVDDSFTQRMLQSPKDLALIRAMRDICQDLDYTLVVEGIENQQQLQKLIDIGCRMGQGRYISPPMPGADIVPLLTPANP
ncbi:TPA: putative bifunctional diguanylate cyclase/phosphodiesterase [Aeromonas veronii]|uniref:Diguanylate phosphodiesterase n=1 Tax=Aeromonas veronii TaxID=654 RepID=A0AAC9B881_AERVE|nr:MULTISPECIES: EAL domain-containing protein [Aeromonas]AEB48094.1 Gaf domain/GGDEF domain/eal domain protein [Aeromonas veronii B565]AMQ41132.1 diguanylate phosphodiesterase [Aeromonas veronii]ANB53500.1 diguanylate phosphodiesterase [Aeromonas veronii]ATY79454.1 GGDEF-domain containing protein [Aeromonas veronii]EKB10669.1 diguanylate cyclase (GGDEF) domain-containing protein [Aeromonas veronii AER397]